MGRTKKVGPTRGLGPRYGVTVRKRYGKVITGLRGSHVCPQCGFSRVRRVSVGVWGCRKCGYKFAGGAYVPVTKLGVVSRRVAKGAPVEEVIKQAEKAEEEEEA